MDDTDETGITRMLSGDAQKTRIEPPRVVDLDAPTGISLIFCTLFLGIFLRNLISLLDFLIKLLIRVLMLIRSQHTFRVALRVESSKP